jgi:DNA-binding NtrC family response regulator
MRTDSALLDRFTRPAPRPAVVVLDEDEDTRVILTARLRCAGFDVVAAASANEASAALGGRSPAVVVSELRGRSAWGRSLLDELAAAPALGGAPLVVNTSRVTGGDRAEAAARGALAFFTKPTDLEGLVRAVLVITTATRSEHSRPRGEPPGDRESPAFMRALGAALGEGSRAAGP